VAKLKAGICQGTRGKIFFSNKQVNQDIKKPKKFYPSKQEEKLKSLKVLKL
jgi:hypothetical protein